MLPPFPLRSLRLAMTFFISAFVTLFVVIDPISIVPVFISLADGAPRLERRRIATRAVTIAFGVALFFILAGRWLLAFLGVTVHAFAISGGILLLIMAVQMLFGQRTGLQNPASEEHQPADPSAFPLALPMLSGPGAIATVLAFASQSRGDLPRLALLITAVVITLALAWVLMVLGDRVLRVVGERGIHILTRVMGVLLSALAVQMVLNGVSGYITQHRTV